jgi:hypothetical protein
MPCAQSSVENNLFHDSPQADRTIECYGWSNLSGSYNLFRNVRDGFHVSEAGDNLRLNWNVGERWNRMPFEVQGHSQARGVEIRWNVFLDWLMPWNDSFGFSAPANDFIEPEYSDNYLKASRVSDWGTPQPGQTKRFGYAIEAGGVKGKCQRNVFIGPWVEYVATTMAKTLCQDNRAYGQMPPWGDKGYGGEPGDHGHGSVLQVNNTHDPNEANAPPLPAYAADALGLAPPDPQPEPEPPTVTVSNLTATAEYDKVKLAWAESGTNGSVTIRRHLKNGAPDPDAPDVVLAAGVRQYTDTRFTAHMLQYRWEFFYAVNGVQSSLVQVGLNPPPDPQPVGDSLDIVSVTTTQIRKGKHVGTTTVKTETPV